MTYHSKPRPRIQHWPKPAGAQTKPKETIVKKLFVTVLFVVSVVLAPPVQASPWVEPVDPTVPVLRWVPKVGPSSVGSVREVRSVRTVRKAGER